MSLLNTIIEILAAISLTYAYLHSPLFTDWHARLKLRGGWVRTLGTTTLFPLLVFTLCAALLLPMGVNLALAACFVILFANGVRS